MKILFLWEDLPLWALSCLEKLAENKTCVIAAIRGERATAKPFKTDPRDYSFNLTGTGSSKTVKKLIATIEPVLSEKSDWVLAVAGKGEKRYLQKIKTRIASLSLRDKVVFTGFVAGAEKKALLRTSEIFVLPSFLENLGIAVIEALENGLAVAVSAHVGLSKTILDYRAGVVFSLEKEKFAEKIRELMDNEKARLSCRENGKRMIRKLLAQRKKVKEYIEKYEMLSKKQAPDALFRGKQDFKEQCVYRYR
jgi:glycosyltransferase involved in cell wall biosynthesis